MGQYDSLIFDEIRERRKRTIEIVLIVFIVGLGINLFSAVIFDWANKYQNTSIIITSLFFVLVIATLVFFLCEKITQDIEFRVFMPFRTDDKSKYTEEIKGYAPTMYLEKLCLAIFNSKTEEGMRFKDGLAEWLNIGTSDSAHFRNSIQRLEFALIVSVIKEYGEHTLTTAVLYHEKYRPLSWRFKSYVIEKDNLTAALQDIGIGSIIGKVRLPDGVSLSVRKDSNSEHGKIVLESSVATIEVEFLPYLTVITKKNNRKTFNVAMRNLENKETVLFSVPVKCSLSVRQHRIFAKKAEPFYEWMHGLLIELNKWLSWDEYAKDDRERLIVEMYKKMQNLEPVSNGNKKVTG